MGKLEVNILVRGGDSRVKGEEAVPGEGFEIWLSRLSEVRCLR